MNFAATALSLPLAIALASALLAPGAQADETTPAPFPSYWDAESWERGSSNAFWRQSAPSAEEIVEEKAAERAEAPQQARAAQRRSDRGAAARSNRAARAESVPRPSATARKILLSHRQTEK